MFNPNASFLYLLALLICLFVLAQSLFFLVRAWRRGKQLGMSAEKLRKAMISSVVLTLPPALAIIIGVVTLSKFLGIPLPWIRLSVIGAITYELPAATATANVLGISVSDTISAAASYASIAWVMTLGILPSIVLPPLLMKKIQSGVLKIKNKDARWGDIFMDALFLGMISAFLGMVFSDVRSGPKGMIPVFTLMVSAGLMALCGLLIKKCGMKWLETYAMSVSIVGAMAFAAVITPLLK